MFNLINRIREVIMQFEDRLIRPKDAAELLACSLNFLAKDRMSDKPRIPFVKMSSKFVRYRLSDLNAFMAGMGITPKASLQV